MRIIISGAGAVGAHLAKMLSQEKHDIVLIDPDENKLRQIGATVDLMPLEGSGTSISDLNNAVVKKADLLIAVGKTEELNITSALIGKNLGAKKTIARIDNAEYLYPKNIEHFKNMGIDYLIYPERIASREIINLLHQTGTRSLIDIDGGKLTLCAVRLEENAPMIDKSLEELNDDLSKYEYRAVAITRDGNTIIPHGDDKLKDNDLVYVITNKKDVEELMKFSGKEMFDIRDIMILGGSRIGKTTAKELGGHHSIKLIELDRAKSYRLSNFLNNALVINGDGRDMNLLMEEGLAKMDAFVAVTGNSETNILSCIFAKRMGVKKTIAEVENMDYITLAENMGIDAIINKKVITASRIFRFTKSEEVASITCLSGTEAEVMEFVAQPDSRITKGPLSDIGFPKTSIVGGVIRANTSFIANGDTVIKPYDKVVVFTLPASMSKLGKFFN